MNAVRKDLEILMPRRGKADSHPGLLLQRYLHESAAGDHGKPEHKQQILQAAINAAGYAEVRDIYKAAFVRWQKSLPELTAANDLQTAGRLIVGLGTENVLETGIRLHHTYSMPVLPGSALKGLAAHYCDQVWGQPELGDAADIRHKRWRKGWKEKGHEYHSHLFGTTEESGCIVFHDAWFVFDEKKPNDKPLKMDVMTPHHPKWNDLDNPIAPTDFDSPIPVPFLSVSGSFFVAISWCGPENYQKAVAWTETAFELLLAGLADWGIGGKTTSGYGRMTETDHGNRKKPFSASALGLPAVGSIVEATLLDAPKKNKPWRAKVHLHSGKELAGPIEGTSPVLPKTGQGVQLIVTEVGENKIRFQWPQPSKK